MFKSHLIKWTVSIVKSSRRYNYCTMKGRFFMGLRVIMVMLLLFPLTAFSQTSSYMSTPGKSAIGMSISFLDNGRNLNGYLISPIDHNTQAIFAAGIGLFDNENLKGTGESIPPSPSGVVALEKTSGLGTTGLQSFLVGGFGASSAKRIRTADDVTLRSVVGLTGFGGAGIFKRLKTSSDWVMTPSFGISYAYTWLTTDDKWLNQKETTESGEFSGGVGLQLDLAPEVSIWGALTFSFDTSDTVLTIGVNWH